MKIEIKNRWSGSVQFSAEIEAKEDASLGVKIGLAVKWALKNKAVLRGAVLRGAVLRGAVLSGAVLRDAVLPFVEPMPDLDAQILTKITDGEGKLEMDSVHTCNTTHCRAGWAITLHPAGRTLESLLGWSVAGSLIYQAAYPKMKLPDFHASNEDALADIKKRAALATSKAKR